jgi:hypothetical protein
MGRQWRGRQVSENFLIPSYRLPSVQTGGAAPSLQVDAPAGAFGANGQALEKGGEALAKVSDAAMSIFAKEAATANNARVDSDVNGFIAAKQKALTDFAQTKGQDAITAAPVLTKSLQDMKAQLLSGTANDYQKQKLTERLDAQIDHADGIVSNHVAQQSMVWQKATTDTRIALIGQDNTLDPMTKADAVVPAAREKAKLEFGAPPDSDVAKMVVAQEQSKVLRNSIQGYLNGNQRRDALALYDRVKDRIGFKDDTALHASMNGIRTQVNGDMAANEALAKNGMPTIPNDDNSQLPRDAEQYRPKVYQAATASNVRPALAMGMVAAESAFRPNAVSPAGARGLTQLMPGTAQEMGVSDPHNVDQSIAGGVRYLGKQIAKYGSEPLGLMAYNWGPGNVDKWIKEGSDPSKVPQETRDYVRRVQGYAGVTPETGPTVFKGDLRAGYEKTSFDISNRPDLSREEKQAALAILSKQQTQVTSYQAAAVKGLKDEANTVLTSAFVAPEGLKPGTFAAYADKAAQLGEQELSARYRLIASMEGTIKNGLASAPADQLKVLKELSEGLPRQLLEGIQGGSGELLAKANDTFAKVKQGQTDGLPAASLVSMARDAAKLYADAGKGEKAREVQQFIQNAGIVGDVTKKTPAAQQQMLTDIEADIGRGQATEQSIELHHLLRDGIAHQNKAFKDDALAAGNSLYNLGPLPGLDDLAGRVDRANKINAARPGANAIPFTQPEIAQMRTNLDTADPAGQAKIFHGLAGLPPEMIPHVAAAIAGKPDASDPLSRSYAAALSFYGQRDPQSQAVGDQILGGAALIKAFGKSDKKAPATDPAWQQALQKKMGNTFRDMGAKVPPVIEDAIASVYTYQMHRAGKQGETIDTDTMNAAMDAVIGKTITHNGQMVLPPKGVDTYAFDNAVRSISDGDLDGLKTTEGQPITAEALRRSGILTNTGKEGEYFVRIPDPRAAFEPRPVTDKDGKAYRLDIKPLLERARMFPPGTDIGTTDLDLANRLRRQAPANPTANVSP